MSRENKRQDQDPEQEPREIRTPKICPFLTTGGALRRCIGAECEMYSAEGCCLRSRII